MSDDHFLEIRTYKLRPGTRAEFDRTFREGALPLLARHGITVVGYGPSVHDDLGYYLMRAYPSLERRQELLDRFYNSDEWVRHYDAPVMALIDQYSTVVIPATAELVAQLRTATAHCRTAPSSPRGAPGRSAAPRSRVARSRAATRSHTD